MAVEALLRELCCLRAEVCEAFAVKPLVREDDPLFFSFLFSSSPLPFLSL